LIGKLEELAHEHCGGDFSQIEVCAEAQAGFINDFDKSSSS